MSGHVATKLSEPLLAGRYAYVRELGKGASGRVLEVEDRVDGLPRAAKLVLPLAAARLRWELELLASLSHPGLARVFELVTLDAPLPAPFALDAGSAALIEELVAGTVASEAVASLHDPRDRARAVVAIGIAVARALAAIHAIGLVHGDVKPANVVVPDDPTRAVLVDLGLARPFGVDARLSGTPRFLAPEAWLGERSVATDLFALGVTLHALLAGPSGDDADGLTGEGHPSDASSRGRDASGSDRDELERHGSFGGAPLPPHAPRLEDLPSEAPLSLRRLIGDLTASEPSARPAHAREVALRLGALAEEVGASIDATSAVSDSPSAAERAARATVCPLTGRDAELDALRARLAEPGVVHVVGPPGSGRSRLIRDAVRACQRDAARAHRAVPTYVALRATSPPRVDHAALVHLEGEVELEACRAAIEAAAVQGLPLTVIVEGRAHPAPDVELGPLAEPALRPLLAALLVVDPAPRLLAAARAASGGLAGRLCRLVADAFLAELDPTRPGTLEELAAQTPGELRVPARSLALAEALAIAGGALGAPALAVLGVGPEPIRLLLAAGLAHEDDEGKVELRADVALALEGRPDAALARRLLAAPLDARAEAFVKLAANDEAGAIDAFSRALRHARDDGDPERAAMIGRRAIGRLGSAPISLHLETADALRARAREREALALLEGTDGPRAAATRGELARLLGDLDRAEREVHEDERAMARAVRARVRLMRGDPRGALEALSGDAPGDAPTEARFEEVRAFAALALGHADDARDAAQRGLALVERASRRGDAGSSHALAARALATDGAVLGAEGRVEEAATRYERACALADEAGERHAAASYLVNVGLSRLELGRPGPAIDALREGARRLTALGRRADAARALYNLGNAASLIGDDDLASAATRRAYGWADEAGDAAVSALAAVVEAELTLRAGRLEAAARGLEEAWADEGAPAAVRVTLGARRAIVAAVRGRLDEATGALQAIEALTADAAAEVERGVARARVALERGDAEEAAAHASRALVAAEGAGWEARLRAALAAADALERSGRDPQAALEKARALLDGAAATLAPSARAKLRAVPAYSRAFRAAPSAPRAVAPSHHRALARVAKQLVREERLDRLRDAIVDAAIELADAERGFLLARADDGALRVLSARAFGADLAGETPSRSIAARVLDGDRPLVTLDALEDARLDRAESVHAMALRSILGVPVPLSRPLALVLDDRLRPGAFDEGVVEAVVDLAAIAAGAIERVEALSRERRERRRLARAERRLAARVASAERELSALRRHAAPAFAAIVAESEPMRRALRMAERVATADAPILILGESGTGKELVARALHDASARRDGPYVGENVSAIPDGLLESALFGHVKGAFTGADRARRGLFELADGGTLFLDEIGEMSPAMQSKLLRVLQDGELRPIGSEATRTVDVRLVSATHRDLPREVAEGRFREDLYYRIAVVTLELPPLRARPEDVAPLCAALLERHAPDRRVRVDPDAFVALRRFAWPGNVRQLENELRRALVLADDVITVEHLSAEIAGTSADAPAPDDLDLKAHVDALERRLIRTALHETDGNRTHAAKRLGLSRYGLSKMMKRLELE